MLSQTKDGLKEYEVNLLAAERDKAGKAVAVQMQGMKVVRPLETPLQVETVRNPALQQSLKQLHDAVHRKVRRKDLTEQPIEQAAPSTGHIAAAMFDNNGEDEEQMPAWAKKLFDKVDTATSQGAAMLSTFSMTQAELEELRNFVKEEEEDLEAGNKKSAAETEDIMSRISDIVGQTIDCKVNNGHPKNSLLLRQNVNLFEQKADDRLHVQFLKHLYKKVFKVFLPHYNKEAMISIVRDSEDASEIAVKNCMSFHGVAWKKTEEEVTGFGGKRIVGKKATPANLLKWHNEITEIVTSSSAQ